jgi:AcrR family transcriptional regulator
MAGKARNGMRADAQRNRQRILEVARESFASSGLSIPIDEIARQAGVGAGTMHRHFPTKELLFEAIILSRVEKLAEEARALRDIEDSGAAFFEFCTRLIGHGVADRALAEALAGVGVDVRAKIAAATQEMHEALGEILVRAQQQGTIRPDVTIVEVKALFAGIHLAAEHQQDADLPTRMMRIICDGLRQGRL